MIGHLDEMLSNERVWGIGKIRFGKVIDHFENFSFEKTKFGKMIDHFSEESLYPPISTALAIAHYWILGIDLGHRGLTPEVSRAKALNPDLFRGPPHPRGGMG